MNEHDGKWSYLEYVFNVQLAEHIDGMAMKYEKKRRQVCLEQMEEQCYH